MLRKMGMKPDIGKDYAALCSAQLPFTDRLFGDDLQKQLKDIGDVFGAKFPSRPSTSKSGDFLYAPARNHQGSRSSKKLLGPISQTLEAKRQLQTNKCSTPEPITSPEVSSINTNSLISKITNQTEFKAGQISSRLSKWTEITSDQSILDSVSGYHTEFHSTPEQHMPPRQTRVALKKPSMLTAEIHKLLSKGVIAVCPA